jgi:hypothetical protein
MWNVADKTLPEALADLSSSDDDFVDEKIMNSHEQDFYKGSSDIIAIFFGFGILEDVALECCKVRSLTEPEKWKDKINELRKEDLFRNMTLLFTRTDSKPTEYDHIKGYKFKQKRLQKIDKLRDTIIYDDDVLPDSTVRQPKGHIKYLENTSRLLLDLVARKYNLEVNPSYIVRWR